MKREPKVVSFSGSPFHGSWNYVWDDEEALGSWTIVFHHSGNEHKQKTHYLKQMKGTGSFSDGVGCTMVPIVG